MVLRNARVQDAINHAIANYNIPNNLRATDKETVVLHVLEFVALFAFDLPTTRVLYRHLLRHTVKEVADAYACHTTFPVGFFTTAEEC